MFSVGFFPSGSRFSSKPSPDLCNLLSGLLQKDPSKRYVNKDLFLFHGIVSSLHLFLFMSHTDLCNLLSGLLQKDPSKRYVNKDLSLLYGIVSPDH